MRPRIFAHFGRITIMIFATVGAWIAIPFPLATAKTNVVLIVSDDQGYNDLGILRGAELITSNLDRLAREGTRLTNFYVAWPACTPSRGALLTGRYPQRNGIYDMIRNEAPDYGHHYEPPAYEVTFERIGGMDTRETLLADTLHSAGYRTAIYGKWDLGSLKRYLPTSRGFEHFYGFVNTGIDYFTHERYGVPSMYRNEQLTEEDKGQCCTQLFSREALRFLEQVHDEPFFLYLPFNAPHNASNLDPKIRGGAQASDEFYAKYPELQSRAGFRESTRYGKTAQVPNKAMQQLLYRASVTEMDAMIGQVLEALDSYGLTDDTLVIFLSDNGGSGAADNSPLRGRKAQMWEGGIRVPCIVRWPERVPQGNVVHDFLTTLELYPTICAATGLELPQHVTLDGFDMLPTLAGEESGRRKEMFWQRRDDKAARVGNWKWVAAKAGGGLFDLSNDIGERNDLSEQEPAKLAELKAAFERWQDEMDRSEPRGPFRDF